MICMAGHLRLANEKKNKILGNAHPFPDQFDHPGVCFQLFIQIPNLGATCSDSHGYTPENNTPTLGYKPYL